MGVTKKINKRKWRLMTFDEKNAKFKKVCEKHSKHPIAYESGRFYFNHYKQCYVSYGMNAEMSMVYQLPHGPSNQKIEDALVSQCNFLSGVSLGRLSCRNSLFCLTAHNMYQRYDFETGKLLEEIYLSSKYKYKHLSWSTDYHSVLLKSTHHYSTTLSLGEDTMRTSQNVFMALCLIAVFPTKFIGAIEIDRRVFGKDVCDAMISQGLLIVMSLNGWVRMYNWHEILDKNKIFNAEIFEACPDIEGTVGIKPVGLPINIRLQEQPPVLFEVRCADHDLQMGGIPWHYMMCPYKQYGVRTVTSVSTGRIANKGKLDLSSLTVEPEKLIFHADDSGKILHIASSKIRVLKISETSPGVHELGETYVIDSKETNTTNSDSQELGDNCSVSSSGRIVKRRTTMHNMADCSYQSIQDVDYENELDLLAVTMVTESDDSWRAHVSLHDNQTGEKQLEIPLEEPWNEFWDHVVAIDLDTIVHIVKAPMRKFSCYVYRLDRKLPDESPKSTYKQNSKQCNKRKQTMRSRRFTR